jgi:periplasmic mercuric ion binding protein
MTCTAVPGVNHVVIFFEDKTATITCDDAKATLRALARVTTDAGHPSAPKS